MAIIENIKQKILQLDAGAFQNLCDCYLSKIGYPNIVSLGGQAGTRKTTRGTPDTYFSTVDGKYVFVEYTTQKTNLFSKIKNDLTKCLDVTKTGITPEKISEIIYCHTSSNIKPSQDNEVKTLCKNAGIKLTLIGIDKLAEELYLYHNAIARDFLGISVSTDQIKSCDDFIKDYNSNKMAAPIDTEFLFRHKEIEYINEAYKNVDIVILNGAAGTGKTRLAVHYAQNYAAANHVKFFCIHSKALPIYEDLKLFIDKPGNYFLFIDDANQLSGLQHIIRYTTMKEKGYNVKILITVRDYALQKVLKDVQEFSSYESIGINTFTDEEIKKLLEVALRISNPNYQERIIRIAEGNARIAMLAGKLACRSNRLDSINDVSQLYEDYYGSSLGNNPLFTDNSLCITAGIVAFLEAIHLDYIDALLPILQEKELCRENFIENIRKLHEMEIVDIYNDKAVRFSEQCLSNYLLKYVFFDKKLLSLSAIIKACFQNHTERTISSINTLLNIFRNEDLYCFVEKEIKTLWDELSKGNSPFFFEFVKAFFLINPTETLLILKNKIDSEEIVIIDRSDIDTESGKNYPNVSDEIINILGGFADTDDLPTALDLFFQYFFKRPDLYMQFYHAANQYFGITKDSKHYSFYTQITFFEKIIEYSDNWQQDFIVILFLELAEEFLKLHFEPAEAGRKNALIIYQIPLGISEGVEKYRGLIWESLATLCEMDNKYKERTRRILIAYGTALEETSLSVAQFDLPYIKSILKLNFPTNELKNCLLANHLRRIYTDIDSSNDLFFNEYLKTDCFQLYRLLKGPNYKEEPDYKKCENIKRQSIEQYISKCDSVMFRRLIDVCNDLNGFVSGHTGWQVSEGLAIAFEAIALKQDYYVDAVKYYIEKDTPNNLNPCRLVNVLFSLLPDSDVFYLISNKEYSQKNAWLYAYYHELPEASISNENLKGLYYFLLDDSDRNITETPFRDVDFLEKYRVIDNDAFIKGCEIILSKIEYSPFITHSYFGLLFNSHANAPEAVAKKFEGHLDLLEKIYIAMLSYDTLNDYDGKFLKEFYLLKPTILDKFIDYLVAKNSGSFNDDQEINQCFFEMDNYFEVYNKIFDQLIKRCCIPTMSVPSFLESILLPVQNEEVLLQKQDNWIRQCIQLFFKDRTKMFCLFACISKMGNDRKKQYVSLFLENNESFKDFEKIPLIPISYSWSGSAIPMYSAWIDFLESLLPDLVGLKWIQHKNYVKSQIASLKNRIESEEIEEILRG